MTSPASRQKPRALGQGSHIAMIAPASPGKGERIAAGKRELERLGFSLLPQREMS